MKVPAILVGLCLCLSAPPAYAQGNIDSDALSLQRRVKSVFEQNQDAVVKVVSVFNTDNPDAKNVLLVGTGFYISKEGHILTNSNVVLGADRIWIERRGIAYVCESIGSDPLTNVSIIRALKLPTDFDFLRLSEKPEPPTPGSFLLAISCELGMAPGPSLGMITGWNTQYVERILPTVYLRTDIPYDGGEGGAPVFDLNGGLVGMVVAALPEISGSFVLPARAIQRVRDDILFSGQVTYAYFGFQTRQTSNLESGPWIEVQGIQEGSPAAEAGIKAGDILKKLGDFEISTDDDLRTASFFTRPEEFVTVAILRDGKEINLEMKPTVREVPITAMPPATPDDDLSEEIPLQVDDQSEGITQPAKSVSSPGTTDLPEEPND